MEAQAAWVRLHSSLVDPDSMPQASQWSSKFVTLAGQAGQGNAFLTEILNLGSTFYSIPYACEVRRVPKLGEVTSDMGFVA